MKLRRVEVTRLPGVDQPFVVDQLTDGFHVLVGPNGIGKSRLCAALRCLLWGEQDALAGQLTVSALFEHEGVSWRVERDGSRRSWQRDGRDSEPPELPGERLSGCFFLGLMDLLDARDATGQELAARIRRQMSGGFDLDTVREDLVGRGGSRPGARESRKLSTADDAVRKAVAQQRQVEEGMGRLAALEATAKEARRAGRRVVALAVALQAAKQREELAGIEAELDGLPGVLGDLDGKEAEAWEALDGELKAARRELEEVEYRLEEAKAAADRTGLDQAVGEELLAEWVERAEALRELERRGREVRDRAEADRARLAAALRDLGRDPEDESEVSVPSPREAAELFRFLREAHGLEMEALALKERLELLAAHPVSAEEQERAALLQRAVGPLRDWLRAPAKAPEDPPTAAGSGRRRWTLLGAALALLGAVGLALGGATSAGAGALWLGWFALGAGLGLAVAGWRRTSTSHPVPGPDQQAAARSRYPPGVEEPASWTPVAVGEQLTSFEEELASLRAAEQLAGYRKADRARIEVELKRLDERCEGQAEIRRELAERLGLDGLRSDAELVDTARAVDAARQARLTATASAKAREELEADRSRQHARVVDFLAAHGVPEVDDAAAACVAVRLLQSRDREFSTAIKDRLTAERDRQRAKQVIANLEQKAVDLFRRAGLEAGDRNGLTLLLARKPRYDLLITRRERILGSIRAAEAQLEAAGEGELSGWDPVRLEEERIVLEEHAERSSVLDQEIGGIKEQIRKAREGHALEDAMAERDEALGELRDRRDDVLDSAAAGFLLDRVRREHETHQMPRVLERARSRFATFTHNRYLLDVSASDGGAFRAVDQTNERGLGLDQLSDGTRAQLILAARLAFAEEAEAGSRLPLFLDEALDHSDPERFHAIARSLARMVADEERQVFYLSNDPTDVERFAAAFREEGGAAPEVIDLAELLGAARRVEGPGELRVEPLPSVPDPTGLTPEVYGGRLGVPAFAPELGAAAQHVYYLLRDDLPLLRALLELRVETVGQCRLLQAEGTPAAHELLESSATGGLELEARGHLLESYCQEWAQGRGRPVGRADLERSGAVSEHFLEAVVRAAEELGGDARALLDKLREPSRTRGGDFKGFHASTTEKLERFFSEEGHLDDRPVLTEDELLARLLTTPAARRLSAPVATGLVHAWWTLGARR